MANRRYDLEKEQVWRLRLDQQRSSGLNVREFCRRESISEPSFYAWRRELKKRDAANSQPANQAVAHGRKVIPVEVVDRPQILPRANQGVDQSNVHGTDQRAMPCVELVAPGGCLLRFAACIEPAYLRTLLDVIAGHESATRTEAAVRAEPIEC